MPDITSLQRVSKALSAANIVHAVGGSGLLHFLGARFAVNDWDITTDAPQHAVINALEAEALPYQTKPPRLPYQSAYLFTLMLDGTSIDIIGNFTLVTPDGTHHIKTSVTAHHQGVPLGSPEQWRQAYLRLNRQEKADWLTTYLNKQP